MCVCVRVCVYTRSFIFLTIYKYGSEAIVSYISPYYILLKGVGKLIIRFSVFPLVSDRLKI
jgi:hypothetical protein